MFVAAEAVRGAARRRAFGAGGARPARRAAVRHPGRDRRRVHAAGDPGPEPVRRLRVPGARSDGSDINDAGGGHPGDGRRPATSRRSCAGPVQLVHRERSAAAGHDRPRARAGARAAAQRDHERDADLPGVAVRQRLRVQQPRLSRLRAGRPAVPVEPAGAAAALRADAQRRDGAARAGRADRGDDRAAGHQPLQPVPLGDDQRIGGAGRQLRRGARGDGAAGRREPAGGHGLRVVGHLARRNQGRPAVGPDLRSGAAARLPDARGAVREPRAAVHRPAGRAAGGARRARRAVERAASPTTSTARSAWSC